MIDWSAIDTVLLDMDGTLLDLQFDNHFWMEYLPRAYARRHGGEVNEAKAYLLAEFDAVRGTLPWYCLDHWSQQLGMDIPALKLELKHMIRARPYTLDFLKRLQEGPHRVLLVTNAHRETLRIKMNEVDISSWFDEIVVSHDFGAPKESQLFWQGFQRSFPFDPSRTLLIDDTESVLHSAQTFGIGHLLTMLQPDSSADKRVATQFPAIHHFDEIMPARTPH